MKRAAREVDVIDRLMAKFLHPHNPLETMRAYVKMLR